MLIEKRQQPGLAELIAKKPLPPELLAQRAVTVTCATYGAFRLIDPLDGEAVTVSNEDIDPAVVEKISAEWDRRMTEMFGMPSALLREPSHEKTAVVMQLQRRAAEAGINRMLAMSMETYLGALTPTSLT